MENISLASGFGTSIGCAMDTGTAAGLRVGIEPKERECLGATTSRDDPYVWRYRMMTCGLLETIFAAADVTKWSAEPLTWGDISTVVLTIGVPIAGYIYFFGKRTKRIDSNEKLISILEKTHKEDNERLEKLIKGQFAVAQALNEQKFAAAQASNQQQFAATQASNQQQFAAAKAFNEQKFAAAQASNEQQFKFINQQISELKSEIDNLKKLVTKLEITKASSNGYHRAQKADTERKIAILQKELAEVRQQIATIRQTPQA